MSIEVKIPAVGESVSTGSIAQWHKQDGEYVNKGEILYTLETDKISTEVEAETSGQLSILVQEEVEVAIGTVVATLDESAVVPSSSPETSPSEEKSEEKVEPITTQDTGEEVEKGLPASATVENGSEKHERRHEEGKDKKEKTAEKIFPEKLSVLTSAKSEKQEENTERFTRKKMSALRRKVATHLVSAQQTAAILTTYNECDMSAVMQLRKQLQENFLEKYGVKLGFMSFFVKAVVDALKTIPQINGRIDGEDIITNHYYDIGVAIGTEKGLLVPVLRDCDALSFADIEQHILDYAQRAHEGKIQIEDLQGGVFTVSNGGVYGSLLSSPIINYPQSGILGMHAIKERPVALNGKVEIRPMMYLALSYDHRLVDGKEAVTFLVRVKECIEQPTRLLVGI